MIQNVAVLVFLVFWALIHTQSRHIDTGDGVEIKNDPVIYVEQFETANIDLDNYFMGSNLSLELDQNYSWASISPKFIFNDEKLNFPQMSKISAVIETDRSGNWLSEIAIIDRSNVIRYGILPDAYSVPSFKSITRFEKEKNIQCYDIKMICKSSYIIDCAHGTQSNFENIFYFLNFTQDVDRPEIRTKVNQNVGKCAKPTDRKLVRASFGDQNFMLRYMPSSKLEPDCSYNNYLEIFKQTADRRDFFFHDLIDRTTFGLDLMAIEDVKMYLDEVFVVDRLNGILRFSIESPIKQQYPFFQYNPGRNFTNLAILPEEEYGIFTFTCLVASLKTVNGKTVNTIYEIDWTVMSDPIVMTFYEVNPLVKRISFMDFSHDFIIMGSMYPNFIYIYRRGVHLYENIYYQFQNLTDPNAVGYFSRATQSLLIMTAQYIYSYSASRNILQLAGPEKAGTSLIQIVIKQGMRPVATRELNITVLPYGSSMLVNRGNRTRPILNMHPTGARFPLYRAVMGPQLWFETSDPHVQFRKMRVLSNFHEELDAMKENYGRTPLFNKFSYISGGKFHYCLQWSDLTLHRYICTTVLSSVGLDCRILPSINLTGRILQLQKSRGYLIVKTNANLLSLDFYHFQSSDLVKSIKFSNPIEECADIDMVDNSLGEALYCTQPGRDTILGYRPGEEVLTPFITITKETLNLPKFFKPQELVVSPHFSYLLYVKDFNRVLVIDAGFPGAGKPPIVLKEINSEVFQGPPETIRLVAVGEHLLLMSSAFRIIEEYDLHDLTAISLRKQYDLLLFNFTFTEQPFVDASPFTSYVYLHGYYTNATEHRMQSVILILKTGSLGSDTLFQIIDLNDTYAPVCISVSGHTSEYDLLTFAATNGSGFAQIYANPYVSVDFPILTNNNLSENHTIQIKASNLDYFTANVSFDLEVVVWNAGLDLQATNEDMASVEMTIGEEEHQVLAFDDHSKFHGAIQNFTVEDCVKEECNTIFKLRNRFQTIGNGLAVRQSNARDLLYYNNLLYVLLDNCLMVTSANNSQKVFYDIPIMQGPESNNYTCTRILMNQNNKMGLVICLNKERGTAKLNLISFLSCRPVVASSFYIYLDDFVDAHFIDNILITMESYSKYPEDSNARIRVFRLIMTTDINSTFVLKEEVMLTGIEFRVEDFAPTSMDIRKMMIPTKTNSNNSMPNAQSNDYMIMVSDINHGLKAIILQVELDEMKTRLLNYSLGKLTAPEYGSLTEVKYQALKIMEFVIDTQHEAHAKIIITTQSFHSYILDVKTKGDNLEIQSLRVFQRYSNYNHINFIKLTQNFLILVGIRNTTRDSPPSLLLYDLKRSAPYSNTSQDQYYHYLVSSLEVPWSYFEDNFRSIEVADLDQDTTKLWINTVQGVQPRLVEYQIYDRAALVIDGDNPTTKVFTIVAHNEYSSSKKSVRVVNKGTSYFILVALLVFGFLIMVSLLVHTSLNKMKGASELTIKVKEDSLLLNPNGRISH